MARVNRWEHESQKQQSGENLFIAVTQEDIDAATRNNSSHCAVAAAVSRQVDAERVSVDIQTIRMTMKGTNERRIYLTPAKAQNYIIGFDAGDELTPFGFHLKRPAYVTHTRSQRLEQGNHAEIVPIAGTPDEVNIRMAETNESDTPAYVGLRVRPSRSGIPRKARAATRREFGLRTMRLNQGYGRSDTKQFGKNRPNIPRPEAQPQGARVRHSGQSNDQD